MNWARFVWRYISYRKDLLAALLPSLGLQPEHCVPENLNALKDSCIVNCIGVSPQRLATHSINKEALIVTDQDKLGAFSRLASTVALPSSFGRMQGGLQKLLTTPNPDSEERTPWIGRLRRRRTPSAG